MTTSNWFDRLRRRLEGAVAMAEPQASAPPYGESAGLFRSFAGRNPEIADVQEQVATEQQGRIVLASRQGELNRHLLALLREQPALPISGPITQEGVFTLIALPAISALAANDEENPYGAPSAQQWAQQEVMDALLGMDVILYLCDYDEGWQPADDRWCSRLRATSIPVLPILPGAPPTANGDPAQAPDNLASLHRHLGIKPVLLRYGVGKMGEAADATAEPAALPELVERILELRPRLAIPLAQEVPACRQLITRRVVRAGALMAALLGMEPLPLLDVPLTVLVQWKMALQLAAIHGRPGVEVLSREMAGTVGLNLLVRTLAQQALKFLPVLGWLFSAALNFLSTWLLGQALLRVYTETPPLRLRARLGGWRQKLRPARQWLKPQRLSARVRAGFGRRKDE